MAQQELTSRELRRDVAFLAERAEKAGQCEFSPEREWGASSNSIVSIAYGRRSLAQQELPFDEGDLAACERMWAKLPEHRKTLDVVEAMRRARDAVQCRQQCGPTT